MGVTHVTWPAHFGVIFPSTEYILRRPAVEYVRVLMANALNIVVDSVGLMTAATVSVRQPVRVYTSRTDHACPVLLLLLLLLLAAHGEAAVSCHSTASCSCARRPSERYLHVRYFSH